MDKGEVHHPVDILFDVTRLPLSLRILEGKRGFRFKVL